MSAQLVAVLAVILAEQARVAGMQAENACRAAVGESPAYGEDQFSEVADCLVQLSIEARNATT